MWIVAVLACTPLVFTFVFRRAVTRAWKKTAVALAATVETPGVFDAFVCRQFRVDGSLDRSQVMVKTFEGESPEELNPGTGFLGWIWDRLFGGRVSYSLRIVVRPNDGVIPTDLKIVRRCQPEGKAVSPSDWETTVQMTGEDFGLLAKENRLAVQKLVVLRGAEIKSGAVVLEARGPLFRSKPVLGLIEEMAEVGTTVSMSIGVWQQLMSSDDVPSSPGVGGEATANGSRQTTPLRGVSLARLEQYVFEAQDQIKKGRVLNTPVDGHATPEASDRLGVLLEKARFVRAQRARRRRERAKATKK